MNWDQVIATGSGIIQFVVILGMMVLFHELGHLVVARLVGMRVYEFSIGFFRPALYSFERGGVTYSIRPIPLGGYVRIAGMEPGDEDAPDGYNTKPLWARAAVICAGSGMNIVLAALFFWCALAFYGEAQTGPFDILRSTTVVERITPNSPAHAVGIKPGDRVVAVNGAITASPIEAGDLIRPNADKKITVTVLRGGRKVTVNAPVEWAFEQWLEQNGRPNMRFVSLPDSFRYPPFSSDLKYWEDLRWGDEVLSVEGIPDADPLQVARIARRRNGYPMLVEVRRGAKEVPVVVSPQWLFTAWAIAKDVRGFLLRADDMKPSVRAAAGLKSGDWIVGIGGIESATPTDMIDLYIEKPDAELTVQRAADEMVLNITPKAVEVDDISWAASGKPIYKKKHIGRIGVAWHVLRKPLSFVEEVSGAIKETYAAAVVIPKAVVWVIKGLLPNEIGGPLRIGAEVVKASYLGLQGVLALAGFISVNLAIINMVPFPALDGFWVAMVGYEAIVHKPLNRRAQTIAVTIGFFVLIGLFVLVTINDIVRLL